MRYSRDFTRRLGFFYTADKGGNGSAENKPQTVAELAAKVKELEAENSKVSGERDQAVKDKDAAIAAQQKAEGERDQAVKDKDAAISAQQKAEGERDQATKNKGEAVAAKEKAEADLKTADQRAEQKLREIDAKNGGTLPGKQAGAGDHTSTDAKTQGLTGMKKATAYFAAKLPEPKK